MSDSAQATETIQENDNFQDLSDSSFSYLELMDEFKQKYSSVNFDYFYLYKFDDIENSKKHKFIDKYDPEIPPDEHEIGIKHGGGRYLVRLVVRKCSQFPSGTQRIYQILIHERYDELKKQKEKADKFDRGIRENTPPAPPPQPPQNNTLDFLTTAEKIMSLIMPLLTPLLTQKKDENSTVMMELVKESFSSMAVTMRESMMENFKMINEMQQRNLENAEKTFRNASKPPKEEDTSLLDKIIPLISPWISKLTGDDVQAKVLQNIVKQSEEFKLLKKDNAQLNKLIQYIVDTEGEENTAKLLDSLGIEYQVYDPGAQFDDTGFDMGLVNEFHGNPETVPIDPPADLEADPLADPEDDPEDDPEVVPIVPQRKTVKKTVKKTAVKSKRKEQQ